MIRGWEIIVVFVIILLLFGPGRIAKIAGELGESIKSFRDGMGKKGEEQSPDDSEENNSEKQ